MMPDDPVPPMPIDVLPFNEAFDRSRAGPISYQGNIVHRAFRLQVAPGVRLVIEVIRSHSPPEQALHLLSVNAKINISGDSRKRGLIWISEWDAPIEVSFDNVKADAKFMMGNATSHQVGASTNDWGNYGMIIREEISDRVWLLRCSQGMMPKLPDFDDLVLRITAVPSAQFLDRP